MSASSRDLRARLNGALRDVPDFPKPGILFKDITPVLADAVLLRELTTAMAAPWTDSAITHVAGIESRGFILAAPVAIALGAGFIPIRKPGKLPSMSAGIDYALEYGSDRLEMHVDACPPPSRVLLVDDVLATGGTAEAACRLIEQVGGASGGLFLPADHRGAWRTGPDGGAARGNAVVGGQAGAAMQRLLHF